MYDWVHYCTNKGTVKLHTQLDLSGNLPCYVVMNNGKMVDIRAARKCFCIESDSIYTYDKGYCDYAWFREIDDKGRLLRHKAQAERQAQGRRTAPRPKRKSGVVADDTVELELQNA